MQKNVRKMSINYSPNFDTKKRSISKVKYLVFHYTGMRSENAAIKRLTSKSSKVSCHYLIKKNGAIIKIVPDLYEVISGLARTEQISGVPLIEVNFQESSWSSSGLKRFFDFLLSFSLLIVLSPFLILIGLFIKISSKGPMIYSQERLGYLGKPYWIYKFRSMIVNAEEKSGPVWASDDDPRVTSLGRILRKFRIDELPQLINVFLGQMSLIGPRPERP